MKDNKYVVLSVDDDIDVLSTMRIVLEANGFIMEEASSAEEGLKKYKSVKPDVIIVDLMMEEVDAGINMVRELRLLKNETPVFLLSSLGDTLHKQIDHASLGLAGVLQKPVNHNHLISTLKNTLNC